MKFKIRELLILVVVFVAVYAGVQFSLQSFMIDGQSMEPTFHHGEYVLIEKLRYHFRSPERGDVIVFENPRSPEDPPLIKRIVGVPGETVEVVEGIIYVNGQRLMESPDLGLLPEREPASVTLYEDEFFVIGDNRDGTTGSHLFGAVHRDEILGRLWLRYWPMSEWSFSPAYAAALS